VSDAICALSTAPGRAAIAIIRASGEGVLKAVEDFFFPKNKKSIHGLKARVTHYGTLEENGTLIDDAIFIPFTGTSSFTGEESFEIHCHANAIIIRRILEILYKRGVRPAAPGEFTRRAYLNGKLDIDAAQAIQEIIDAKNIASLNAAHLLQRGAFRTNLLGLRSLLLNLLADLNAELDFIDEDIAFATLDKKINTITGVQEHIHQLLEDSRRFSAYKDGVHIAIVGEPNAGKSSLMNRLLGEERSIVSDIAGTTRDYIEGELTLAGLNARLFDTAGLNPKSQDPIERMGIDRTQELIRKAHIVLHLIDGSKADAPRPLQISSGATLFRVVNKIDILYAPDKEKNTLYISAKTGEGIPDLLIAMEKHIYGNLPQNVLSLNEWQREILSRIHATLVDAKKALLEEELPEVVTHLVDNAVQLIATLTGQVSSEDVLGRIFSRFCIGK